MKKILSIILCGVLVLIITGCGNSEKDKFIGVFLTKYPVKGDQYYEYLDIKKDGTYESHKYKYNEHVSTVKGDYEISADTIILYRDKNHNSWTELTYRGGKLTSSTLYYERYEGKVPEKK